MQQAAAKTVSYQPDELDCAILSTLLYFNIFNHPLTAYEVYQNCHYCASSEATVHYKLAVLKDMGLIHSTRQFYMIGKNEQIAERRVTGGRLAQKYLQRARIIARFIAMIPYVRSVLVSGSLSKGYMDKGSDIDYFIVTEKGRLWLCRSMLAVLRKLMPRPLKKYFCINYFVDSSSLAIPDRNLFTATELAFVYPVYDTGMYQAMMEANPWVKDYYPNKVLHYDVQNKTAKLSPKKVFEWLLKGRVGDAIDNKLFRFMMKRWKQRYRDFDEREFDLNIRTKKHVSKQHEKGYQSVILEKYADQVSRFEQAFHIRIQHG